MSLNLLKFKPRYLEKMWGGRKIEQILGKTLPPGKPIGESWELYDFPPGVADNSGHWLSSEVASGPLAGKTLHDLVLQFGPDLYGDLPLVGPHGQFPILIKFLDAAQDLSLQVHPDRHYAAAHPEAHLKSEAWYIVQADPGSRLLKDLKPGVTPAKLHAATQSGTVDELIESVMVHPGQSFYLPSGTVHALGAGILAAEVQTPSDTTFRLFDFNRVDPATGKLRNLHVDQAMACIDFAGKPTPPTAGAVQCEYFHIAAKRGKPGSQSPAPAGPAVIMMLDGHARASAAPHTLLLSKGDTLLVPASVKGADLEAISECLWLEVTFPGSV
ncbi:MAG: type I phosphomannose isomerase catalytic subunit [Tepidisphaeraceae bacterium]